MDTNSFELDWDGWTTGGMDHPFTRKIGSTPTANTGPSGAADGSYYVYTEIFSGFNLNKNFDLEKIFPAGQELYGIAFQYHMYGAAMGSAVLETSANGTSWALLWSKSGNMGNQWLQAKEYVGSGQTMLRFTYRFGSSSAGDFALDDIQLGDCLTVGCVASSTGPLCIDPSGTCDPATGRCSSKADGTTCDLELETTDTCGVTLKHKMCCQKSLN